MIQGKRELAFNPITEREKWLTGQIVGIAITIHKALGPGLPENVYEKCFCYELAEKNIPFERQKWTKLVYNKLIIEEGLRIDIMVDDLILIVLKTQESLEPVWEAKLLSYLRQTGKRLGYILNFHTPLMKDGIKRMIYH